jgi:hypothetical protein
MYRWKSVQFAAAEHNENTPAVKQGTTGAAMWGAGFR